MKPKVTPKKSKDTFEFFINLLTTKISIYILGVLTPIFFNYAAQYVNDYFGLSDISKGDVTATSFVYERETINYKVYSLGFRINNTGNTPFSIHQVIPFDNKIKTYNFLQNGKCEIFKESIEPKSIKNFNVHVFINKNYIEIVNNLSKAYDFDNRLLDPKGNPVKAEKTFLTFEISANIQIYGSDQKYKIAVLKPMQIILQDGKESVAKINKDPVDFNNINNYVYDCPINSEDT